MNQVYTYLPLNEAYTKRTALKKYYTMQIIFGIMSVVLFLTNFLKSNVEMNNKSSMLKEIFVIVILLFPLINLLLSRFPIKVEISELSNSVRVTYLNGFGDQNEDIIGIKNAQIRYTLASARYPKSGMQFRIIQNLFINWIHISLSHGFTKAQILEIYEKAKKIQDQ